MVLQPMEYNPDELAEQASEAENIEFSADAEITEIETKKAGQIFGDKTQGDSQEEMLVVHATAETSEGEIVEIEEVFSLPKTEMSWANPRFKLRKFKERYGDVPRVGQEVETTTNENGFLRIDY